MKQAEIEMLTGLGEGRRPGSCCGGYWHPVLAVGELTEEKPIKRVTRSWREAGGLRLPLAAG